MLEVYPFSENLARRGLLKNSAFLGFEKIFNEISRGYYPYDRGRPYAKLHMVKEIGVKDLKKFPNT